MNEQKVLSLLGLAQRAGMVVSGETAVEKAVRSGKAKLVLIAQDASENTRKSYCDLTQYYQAPLFVLLTKEQLGAAIGKVHRAALAIIDKGLSEAIAKALEE